jgi:hypothetical protein
VIERAISGISSSSARYAYSDRMAHQTVALDEAEAGFPPRPGSEDRNALRSALDSSAKSWRPCSRAQAASRRAAVTYCSMVPGLLCLPLKGSQSAKPLMDELKRSATVTPR